MLFMLAEDIVSMHWHVPLPAHLRRCQCPLICAVANARSSAGNHANRVIIVLHKTSTSYMEYDHDICELAVSCMQHACLCELDPAGKATLYLC